MTTRTYFPAVALALAISALPAAHAQEPAPIQAPITTGFGVYSPFQVPQHNATAGLSEPTLASGFANIATPDGGFPWDQYFTAEERSLLQRNNFLVRPEAFGSFGELYGKSSGSRQLGSFVTVDAVLHGLRVSIAEIRGRVERDFLAPELAGLLGDLSARLAPQVGGDGAIGAAALQALAYVETGRALFDATAQIDPRVRSVVTAEVESINGARGVGASSVFPGRRIDYAMFVPTANYKGDLASYYRARAWLGGVGLPLRTEDATGSAAAIRMATALAKTVDVLATEGDFGERYLTIYETIAFLDGRSELDVTWDMIAGALRGFYGRMAGAGIEPLREDASAVQFAAYVEKQIPASATERAGARMFRFLPSPTSGRGIVDRVAVRLEEAPSRVIGAAVAASITGADEYRRAFSARLPEAWIGSLESALLYTVQPIAAGAGRENGQPRFMRTQAWATLGASRALGAWADYQHPLAFLKMTSIRLGSGQASMQGDLGSPGYVEPSPEAWARVAALAAYIRSGFARDQVRGIIGAKLETRLRDIENTAARLMQIAANELANREITSEQASLIAGMPSRIAAYESFTDTRLSAGGRPIVAGAALSGSGRAPATGHPLTVFVVVPRNDGSGGLMLTRGGVYSYFESTDPDGFNRSINSGSGDLAPALSLSSLMDERHSFSQNSSRFEAIESAQPEIASSYTPTREERKRMAPTAEIVMESNTVRRSEGELWFTVKAPLLDGSDVIIAVLNSNGREVYRMPPVRIEGGERYDLIQAGALQPGLYFVRVTDHSGRPLASGRFAVVQ